MRIFICWAGDRARIVARELHTFLVDVLGLQDDQVFMSQTSIRPGGRSVDEIEQALVQAKFGVVVVTPEGLNSRWLHFEAGALAARLTKIRVVPFLVGVDGKSIVQESPLGQVGGGLQAVSAHDEDEVRAMVRTINGERESGSAESSVDRRFALFWPAFRQTVLAVPEDPRDDPVPTFDQEEAIAEILRTVRQLSEQRMPLPPAPLGKPSLPAASAFLLQFLRHGEQMNYATVVELFRDTATARVAVNDLLSRGEIDLIEDGGERWLVRTRQGS